MLGRRGQVVERHRVERLPFTIGRDYTNALILEDRRVSPRHATIERDEAGQLWLWDAGSENGVELDGRGELVPRVPLASSVRVRLGHTTLRLRPPDHPVEPTLPVIRVHPFYAWATSHPFAAVLAAIAVVGWDAYEQWRVAIEGIDPAALVRSLLGSLLVVAVWAGAWALVSRLLVHAARFGEHWIASASGLVSASVLGLVFTYARFFSTSITPLERWQAVATGAVIGGVLFWQLGIATALTKRRRATAALLAICLFVGFRELEIRQEKGGWLETLPYWSRLEPVDPDRLPTQSADAFFARTDALRARLAESAAELDAADAREAARRAARVETTEAGGDAPDA